MPTAPLRTAAAVAGAFLGLAAQPTSAQAPPPTDRFVPGTYVGAELGGSNFDNACDRTALSCDHTDSVGALFGGYRFDSRFAIEVGGRDLGEARATYPRLTSTIDAIGKIDGYDLSALMRFPFGRAWEAYVRGGAYYWNARTDSPEFSASASDWSPSGGGGIAWQFKPAWQLRFQYLYVGDVGDSETGEANVEMLTAGVSYLFGGRRAAAATVAPATPPPPVPPPLPICSPPLPAWDSNIYFPFDSAAPRDLESLSALAQRLREQPQATVRITGFTDASGSSEYNLALSRRRAEAVADFLRTSGIEASRILVAWEGEAAPVTGGADDAALSRRVRVTSPEIAVAAGNCRSVPQ